MKYVVLVHVAALGHAIHTCIFMLIFFWSNLTFPFTKTMAIVRIQPFDQDHESLQN